MKNTKSKILTTAKSLFNSSGYSNVTIRMIALELKMSSGNLNYHFKTREDILEALYFEMVEEFDSRMNALGKQEITIQTIHEDIYISLKRMIEYRFIWTDLYNLLRLNKSIKKHFDEVYVQRFAAYEYLLTYLTNKGLFKGFEFTEEGQLLIERMLAFNDTWLYNSFIYEKKIDDNYIYHQTNNLLAMLYPYLTNLGKEHFKKLNNSYFL